MIPYYERFMQRFPDVQSLANAELDDVLSHWTGLGYYARGRNLHKAAQLITQQHHAELPNSIDGLMQLPGIGRSTAGAILSIAFQQRHAILDGNVKRVLARLYAIEGWPGEKKVSDTLWELAEQLTPHKRIADYTQAIMDFGATVCTRSKPVCDGCVFVKHCKAFQSNRVSDYPHRKASAKKPVKQTCFVICQNDVGQVLLEQRPPVGLWGGLWSFPEATDKNQARKLVSKKLGLTAQATQSLPTFRHTFSHFHLDVQPLYFKTRLNGKQLAEHATLDWVSLNHVNTLGLAAPVKNLLNALEGIDDTNGTLRKTG